MPTPHPDRLRLTIRISHNSPNHHLSNNNGTWWINFTVRAENGSTQRIRRSLKTGDVEKARTSRDRILRALRHASGRIAALTPPTPEIMTASPASLLAPETIAYQHAGRVWEEFHAESTRLNLGERLQDLESCPSAEIAEALRILPGGERTPVAFGVFLHAASHWTPLEQTVFLGEFLPGPSVVERRILEAAARGALKAPEKLPVTLEEFPSRIWQRAIASGSPTRLIHAGHQAVLAMLRLYFRYEVQGEPTPPDFSKLQPGEEMEFRVPSGDLPPIMDLLGLPPFTLPEMKGRVLEWIMDAARKERFALSCGQDHAFFAWVFADTPDGPKYSEQIAEEAATMLERLNDRKSLHSSHHAQRLGRLLFRLGRRRESIRCAKAVGLSPWQQGWQFQTLVGSAHTRIRARLVRPGIISDAWTTEPALAGSAMSMPLWLVDPVNRVPDLVELFRKADACPWIFPRLHHVYQWHLALCGKQETLREVEAVDPEFAIGLAAQTRSAC
jgi:hypothetical protein